MPPIPAVSGALAVTLTPGPDVKAAGMGHYTIELPDGRVAVLGGHGLRFAALSSLEVWIPGGNSFTALDRPFNLDGGALVRLGDGRYPIWPGDTKPGLRILGFPVVRISGTNPTVTAAPGLHGASRWQLQRRVRFHRLGVVLRPDPRVARANEGRLRVERPQNPASVRNNRTNHFPFGSKPIHSDRLFAFGDADRGDGIRWCFPRRAVSRHLKDAFKVG